MKSKFVAIISVCSLVTGCSITQTIDPLGSLNSGEVCIIENKEVKDGFLAEFRNALHAKNFIVKTLPPSATINDCPVVATYVARWSWDLTIYMSYAEIIVYQNGEASGKAVYDATSGGGRLAKFIDAEPKIRELVHGLFNSAG